MHAKFFRLIPAHPISTLAAPCLWIPTAKFFLPLTHCSARDIFLLKISANDQPSVKAFERLFAVQDTLSVSERIKRERLLPKKRNIIESFSNFVSTVIEYRLIVFFP